MRQERQSLAVLAPRDGAARGLEQVAAARAGDGAGTRRLLHCVDLGEQLLVTSARLAHDPHSREVRDPAPEGRPGIEREHLARRQALPGGPAVQVRTRRHERVAELQVPPGLLEAQAREDVRLAVAGAHRLEGCEHRVDHRRGACAHEVELVRPLDGAQRLQHERRVMQRETAPGEHRVGLRGQVGQLDADRRAGRQLRRGPVGDLGCRLGRAPADVPQSAEPTATRRRSPSPRCPRRRSAWTRARRAGMPGPADSGSGRSSRRSRT